jgi:hypothetical protein
MQTLVSAGASVFEVRHVKFVRILLALDLCSKLCIACASY